MFYWPMIILKFVQLCDYFSNRSRRYRRLMRLRMLEGYWLACRPLIPIWFYFDVPGRI